MVPVVFSLLASAHLPKSSCGSSLILAPETCRSVHVDKQISHGIVKAAFDASVHGVNVVVKQPLQNGADSGTFKTFLPAAKLLKEAMYLHHMACKYPDHIAFYGVCIANDILESFLVMGKGYAIAPDADVHTELHRLDDMGTVLADLKREQFVSSENGTISLIDWGDVVIKEPGWGFFL